MVYKKPRFRRKTKSTGDESSNSSDLILGLVHESFWADRSLYNDAERNYYQHVVIQQKTGFVDKRKSSKGFVGKAPFRQKTKSSSEEGQSFRRKTKSSSEGQSFRRQKTKSSSEGGQNYLTLNLAHDNFWLDKFLYNDAERDYYQYLQKENKINRSHRRTRSSSMKNKKTNTTINNKNISTNKNDSGDIFNVDALSEDIRKLTIKSNKKDSEKQQKEVKFRIQLNQGRRRTKSLMNPTKQVQNTQSDSNKRKRTLSTTDPSNHIENLLTPYQGSRKSFGEYECYKCEHVWYSPHAWANKFQQCQHCNLAVYPWRMYPLQPSPKKKDKKPHPKELCEKCKELKRPCWISRKKYLSV